MLHLIDRVLFAESAEAPAPQPTNPVSSAVARGPLAALLAGAAAALALVLA